MKRPPASTRPRRTSMRFRQGNTKPRHANTRRRRTSTKLRLMSTKRPPTSLRLRPMKPRRMSTKRQRVQGMEAGWVLSEMVGSVCGMRVQERGGDAMNGWTGFVRVAVAVGLMCPSPVAWAQLADIDPALNAAVEALVIADPEVAGNPELAQLCRTVAESTVTDIRERVAVTQEAALMQREGVDMDTVIPQGVRDLARETFARVQGDMQRELETLRSVNPERAREVEFRMREGERTMQAFESGERYVPSPEMVAHAREMFSDWESGMLAQGAPQEYVEQARMEMARFSSGEGMMFGGGPGREFGGPGPMGGPGREFTGPAGGQMPSVEQMQTMGMTADQIQAAQAGGHTLDGMTYGGNWEGGSNYGVNPATGGWEPNMGGGMAYGGGTDWTAGGGTYGGWDGSSTTMSTELRQDYQTNITQAAQERYENAIHVHQDATSHVHEIHVHSDNIRHDHTATSPADVAPGAQYIP